MDEDTKKLVEDDPTIDSNPVICSNCGNDSFTLFYGHYELFGVCTQCGAMQSVYSG